MAPDPLCLSGPAAVVGEVRVDLLQDPAEQCGGVAGLDIELPAKGFGQHQDRRGGFDASARSCWRG